MLEHFGFPCKNPLDRPSRGIKCPRCGEYIHEGDDAFFDKGTGILVACENCTTWSELEMEEEEDENA